MSISKAVENSYQEFGQHRVVSYSLRHFLLCHLQALFASIGRMYRYPLANIMTIAVIGIALSLPVCLYIVLQNIQKISSHWQRGTQISLYLQHNVSNTDIDQLLNQIRLDPRVAEVHYVSPKQGMEQLEQQAGFQHTSRYLPENPLPGVIEVYPVITGQDIEPIRTLAMQLQTAKQVQMAKLDMQWLERLQYFIVIAKRSIYGLVGLLSLVVLLVISNTIYLLTQNRRQEIEVLTLLGASNRFVRRPFLYTGVLYGLFGSLIAWFLVMTLFAWLHGPVQQLSYLYDSEFVFSSLNLRQGFTLLAFGAMLGLGGAIIAVNRQLTQSRKL